MLLALRTPPVFSAAIGLLSGFTAMAFRKGSGLHGAAGAIFFHVLRLRLDHPSVRRLRRWQSRSHASLAGSRVGSSTPSTSESEIAMTTATIEPAQRTAAKAAGAIYLIAMATSMFAELYARAPLIVSG